MKIDLSQPKKIKFVKRETFTIKRNPYKKYNNAEWKWEDIFNEINQQKEDHKILKSVSTKYNINYGTLRNKYSKYIEEENTIINKENRGGHNRIFTEQEEREIFFFIKENFIDKKRILCNEIIKNYALKKFNKLYPTGKFTTSDGWCTMFKKRWHLSTAKISISKVASVTYTEEEINEFLEMCKKCMKEVGANFF